LLSSCARQKPPTAQEIVNQTEIAYSRVHTLKITNESTVSIDGRVLPKRKMSVVCYYQWPNMQRVEWPGEVQPIEIVNGAYGYFRNKGENYWERRPAPTVVVNGKKALEPMDPMHLYRETFPLAKNIRPVRSAKCNGVDCWQIDYDLHNTMGLNDSHETIWIGKRDGFLYKAVETQHSQTPGKKRQTFTHTFIVRDIQVNRGLPAGWFAPPPAAKIQVQGR
jgi:hypothetical protein